MKYKIFSLLAFLLLTSFSSLPSKNFETKITTVNTTTSLSKIESVYFNLKSNSFALPSFDCFSVAMEGFYKFKEKGIFKKNILTLIDFSKSSINGSFMIHLTNLLHLSSSYAN
mgnify:CR=1 FL=1